MIRLVPRQQRRVAYVELPPHNYIDLAVYRPVSFASLRMQLFLNQCDRDDRSRNSSLGQLNERTYSVASLDTPTGSEYEDSIDITHVAKSKRKFKGKREASKTETGDREALKGEGTTCHQCRQKTTKEKMRCRKLRPNSIICPFFYCKRCIDIRYVAYHFVRT